MRTLAQAGLTAGLTAVLLAGCGGSSGEDAASSSSAAESSESGSGLAEMTGPEVTAAAADALEEAGAARLTGTISQQGTETAVDIRLEGDSAAGTLTVGGQPIELISTGGAAYLKAPGEFWSSFGAPPESVASLDGQWVTVPAEAATQFSVFTLPGFLEQLRATDPSQPVQEEVRTGELDGEPVVVVTSTDADGQVTGELSVAAEGEPLPLQATSTGTESPGTLTFSDFGETTGITAPEAPLDLSQVGGS